MVAWFAKIGKVAKIVHDEIYVLTISSNSVTELMRSMF